MAWCICAEIRPYATRTRFLVLQHPQEAKRPLGSARLLSLILSNSVLRVGLSWRSLGAALGLKKEERIDPKRWAVLFLGPLKDASKLDPRKAFQIVEKGGRLVASREIDGIVLLDGNWKQSKTLWWRNPWLLKLHRVLLNPDLPSLYGSLRKEPRKNCLSTLEAAAESLLALGDDPDASNALKHHFARFLDKARGGGQA